MQALQIDLVAQQSQSLNAPNRVALKKAVKSNLLQLIWRQRAVTWLIRKYFHNDVKHI